LVLEVRFSFRVEWRHFVTTSADAPTVLCVTQVPCPLPRRRRLG
jgi:hypothetical protein